MQCLLTTAAVCPVSKKHFRTKNRVKQAKTSFVMLKEGCNFMKSHNQVRREIGLFTQKFDLFILCVHKFVCIMEFIYVDEIFMI